MCITESEDELSELRKDKLRLDFMLQGRVVLNAAGKFFVASPQGQGELRNTPREAIQAAMKASKE